MQLLLTDETHATTRASVSFNSLFSGYSASHIGSNMLPDLLSYGAPSWWKGCQLNDARWMTNARGKFLHTCYWGNREHWDDGEHDKTLHARPSAAVNSGMPGA
jgi:hypothetical protein